MTLVEEAAGLSKVVFLVQMFIGGRWTEGNKYPNEASAVSRAKDLERANVGNFFRVVRHEVIAVVGQPPGRDYL